MGIKRINENHRQLFYKFIVNFINFINNQKKKLKNRDFKKKNEDHRLFRRLSRPIRRRHCPRASVPPPALHRGAPPQRARLGQLNLQREYAKNHETSPRGWRTIRKFNPNKY